MLSRREMGALCASLLFCLLLSLGAGWAQSQLTTDGKFGASTVAAVKRYQTRHNLTSDGSVGKDTWEKMFPAA